MGSPLHMFNPETLTTIFLVQDTNSDSSHPENKHEQTLTSPQFGVERENVKMIVIT